MNLKILITCTALVAFFLLPLHALAVDFSITDVKIDAHLQSNGNVKVQEVHTYEFDGEFNGILRELIPKKGTEITDFQANEAGNSLKIEKEDTLYKIYRSGKDETITVTVSYFILGGVDVYQDVAEFYWPFFDKSNESTYENLMITIHPPTATNDIIAFGYDEAFATETIATNGEVRFHLGYVRSNKNGDIRVAYDAALFDSALLTAQRNMLDSILDEQQEGITKAAKWEETRNTLSNIAKIGLPIFSLLLGALLISTWAKARQVNARLNQEIENDSAIPKQIMSLPATMYYTNYRYLSPQAIAAALLDLVRQGYVQKTSNKSFRLINRNVTNKHEEVLLSWLFDEIGENNEFSFDNLDTYMKNNKQHATYTNYQSKWSQAVKEEVKKHQLTEEKTNQRIMVGFSSLLLLPFLFFFPAYSLFAAFFFTILLIVTVISYAIFYQPKTWEGAKISQEWGSLRKSFKSLSKERWNGWTEEERMRAFIYALGINEKSMQKKNKELATAFQKPTDKLQAASANGYVDVTTLLLLSSTASSSFHSANRTISSSGDGGSGFSGGGSGAGGGGGGSGAF